MPLPRWPLTDMWLDAYEHNVQFILLLRPAIRRYSAAAEVVAS